jgi:hypothetical protein
VQHAERLERLHHGHVQAARAGQCRQPTGPEMSVRDIRRILLPAPRQMITEGRDVQPCLIAGRPAGPVLPARPAGRCSTVTPGARVALAGSAGNRLVRKGDLVPKAAQRLGKRADVLALAAASRGRGELDCEATRAILITSLLRAAVGDRRDHAGSAGEEGREAKKKAHLRRSRRTGAKVCLRRRHAEMDVPRRATLNIGRGIGARAPQAPRAAAPVPAARCGECHTPGLVAVWRSVALCWPVAFPLIGWLEVAVANPDLARETADLLSIADKSSSRSLGELAALARGRSPPAPARPPRSGGTASR